MSRMKLLKRTAVSALANLRQQRQPSHACNVARVATPAFSQTHNNTKIGHANLYNNNYLITTNLACFRDAKKQLSSSSSSNSAKFVSLLSSPTDWSANIGIISRQFGTKSSPDRAGKSDTKASAATAETDIFGESSKLGVVAKFKLMYKQYWYVLIPVHVVTSLGWVGAFYYMSKCGVDIPGLLQLVHISDSIIEKVQNSNMGHYAIAYLCYKVVTPLRYAMTVGVTTVSIKHLVQKGHIKPIPSKKQLIQMYEQKKACRAAAKAAEKENN